MATHTVGGVVYAYTYDDVGNILTISENNVLRYSYTYDKLGQLTSANYYSDAYYTSEYYDIYEYAYDKAGNITSVGHHYGEGISNSDIKTYTYGNETWGDLLTNYNGTNITYDAIGNPLNWRNATSLTWQGRRLTNMVVNGTAMSFTYNPDGIRQSKTYGNTTVNYILDGSKIIAENRGGIMIYYAYDENATIMGMLYGGEMYTFRKNLQGDVTGIYNANGDLVVEYTYSPYGEVLSTTGTQANTIGTVNPFRYRSYYYDTETGFYYLQTRYYDPMVGRFLNADTFVSTGQGILSNNMFSYCLNNPIMRCDNTGQFPITVAPAAVQYAPYALAVVIGLMVWGYINNDNMENGINGFAESVTDTIDGIKDRFSERSRVKEEQERIAKERAREKAKLERKKAELREGWCIIVGIYDGHLVVYRGPVKLTDAIHEVRLDLLSGTNKYLPPNCENWGIYAFNQSDAQKFVMNVFGAIEFHTGLHDEFSHYHSVPHYIMHNGINTNVHAWYLG